MFRQWCVRRRRRARIEDMDRFHIPFQVEEAAFRDLESMRREIVREPFYNSWHTSIYTSNQR